MLTSIKKISLSLVFCFASAQCIKLKAMESKPVQTELDTQLLEAIVKKESCECIEKILDKGPNVGNIQDIKGQTVFHRAADDSNLAICSLLINHAQRIEKLFKTAQLLFNIKKYFPQKLPFPKPVLFLILNKLGPIHLPCNKKEYPTLRTMLEKQFPCYNKISQQTAYQTAYAIAEDKYILFTHHWTARSYSLAVTIQKLSQMKKLLDPNNYPL